MEDARTLGFAPPRRSVTSMTTLALCEQAIAATSTGTFPTEGDRQAIRELAERAKLFLQVRP